MAELRYQTSSGYAPLRVQQQFRTYDDGRGGRAAALAEALGVVLDKAPKVVEHGANKAFEAGMKARVDGVKRENADSANKSMLGFMFSKRAQDGFDYQDAQLDLPMIQMEEMLDMEAALHDARSPEDFKKWVEGRDQVIHEKLKDRPDLYRYTVAESLSKTRADQAKLFTGWVQRNREKDRRKAIQLAAKAQAEAAALKLRNAGAMVWASLAEGQQAPTRNVTGTAPEGFALPTGDQPELSGTPLSFSTSGSVPSGEDTVVGGQMDDTLSGGSDAPMETGGNTYEQTRAAETFSLMTADGFNATVTRDDVQKIGGDWFGSTVKSAIETHGIKPTDAKAIALNEAITYADLNNDPSVLLGINPQYLDHKQRKTLADAIDTITKEADAARARAEELKEAEELKLAEQQEAEANAAYVVQMKGVLDGTTTIQAAVRELGALPYYQENRKEFSEVQTALAKTHGNLVDPAMDAFTIAQFEDEALRVSLTGDRKSLQDLVKATLADTSVSPEARSKVVEIYSEAEKWTRDQLFEDLSDFDRDIEQTFPSGVGDEQVSGVDALLGKARDVSYPAEAATIVKEKYRKIMIGLSRDWYNANEDMARMPYGEKMRLAQEAYEHAVKFGERKFANGGKPEETQGSEVRPSDDPLGQLQSIVGKTD